MSNNSSVNCPNLRITGPVSVTPVVPGDLPGGTVILILGPTGAGKSAFIEAFSKEGSLHISSNRLEGFTQSIGTYKLDNILRSPQNIPIYLIDVPGFADTKISQMNIISMLREWMKVSPTGDLGLILYLTPVHNARLSGSHRQVIRSIQAMTGRETAPNITIVTTMWDTLWGNGAKARAESNFDQLRDSIWQEFLDAQGQIVKFYNSKESALSILNIALGTRGSPFFALEQVFKTGNSNLNTATFADHLHADLNSRIQNLLLERQHIEADLKVTSSQFDEALRITLVTQLAEVDRLLTKFTSELRNNFEPDLPLLPSQMVLDSRTTANGQSLLLQADAVHPVTNDPSSGHILPITPLQQDMVLSTTTSPAFVAEATHEPLHDIYNEGITQGPTRGATPSTLIQVLRALKCWGEDTRRRYDD